MEVLIILIGVFLLIFGTIIYYMLGISKIDENQPVQETKIYIKKNFMTQSELFFYEKIKELETDYKIVPQINLATIIKKTSKGYINELFRNIDFAIFDKEYKNLLLLIELNDSTHNDNNRKDRDLKVKKICNDANIKLIVFYTKYPNEKDYVLRRINNELSYINNDN